jgi:hypothetical protein
MYTLAATAAGVSALALSQAAQAKIVYTPANIRIPVNGGLIELDLNHDGVNDFQFSHVYKTLTRKGYHLWRSSLNVAPAQTLNRAVRVKWNPPAAAALTNGYSVNINNLFQPDHNQLSMARSAYSWSSGPPIGPDSWANRKAAFLGLEFLIQGKIHFGWARLNVAAHSGSCKRICATITGYAYETVPLKPILAGKTKGDDDARQGATSLAPSPDNAGTLGRLAQGAPGLAGWR